MENIKEETLAFLTKWWAYLFYIFLGVMGKFSFDIVKKRRISLWYAIGVTGISCFIGFLASMWFMAYHPGYAPYGVPIATLFSDKILMYMATLNWKSLLDSLYGFVSNTKK